jgi:hypothetical protein
MVVRTQITLRPEQHHEAKLRAAELGISLAEYVRRLVDRDLRRPARPADPSIVFNLGHSGGSDIAGQKDAHVGEAVLAEAARELDRPEA